VEFGLRGSRLVKKRNKVYFYSFLNFYFLVQGWYFSYGRLVSCFQGAEKSLSILTLFPK